MDINLVEASIEDLQNALSSGNLTSVDLVARYLRRISKYDCRNVTLNAIPVINTCVFDEAAESDDRRAAGESVRLLEGIPYTIKDSFKAKGMAAAAGSPAFKDLISDQDAFLVETIRAAGAVLIGRTNMPAMACGGMQRGIWGRAENPYNPDYLAAAFVSGSSNGSAVSTASSFAAFGLGAETVSSGRSPASNNGLIAYTPSRGWLSGRGNWPLYPTCDVPVPHTRTMEDLLRILDAIAVEDPIKRGDFWREQTFVKLTEPWHGNRPDSFREISSATSLSGLRIAVPEIFIGGPMPSGARAIETSPEIIELWSQASRDLKALGAEMVLVPDFPALTAYENNHLLPRDCPRLPTDWNSVERGALIAIAWNEFLEEIGDATLPNLFAVDVASVYPDWLRTEPELQFFEKSNGIKYDELKDELRRSQNASSRGMMAVQGLKDAVIALEGMRKRLLEDWLTDLGCDCVVFPSAADVGPADADTNFESAAFAWQNGTYLSNGNRAIRHLGIPTVSVPMGIMRDKHVPVNLTFAGRAYDDVKLLRWANAFEAKTQHRIAPTLTPVLDSDSISLKKSTNLPSREPRPTLVISKSEVIVLDDQTLRVTVQGSITVSILLTGFPVLEASVDATPVPSNNIVLEKVSGIKDRETVFSFEMSCETHRPPRRDGTDRTWAPVTRDKIMVVILARAAPSGRPSGWLGLLEN